MYTDNSTETTIAPSSNIRPDKKIVIAAQNLTKDYRIGKQNIRALDDISLDIRAGEFVALVGSSGSGKSTLLQIIGGLDKPTSGTVEINNTKLSHMNDKELSEFRNQTIGFVFQFFYLQPFLTLARNIEIAAMPNRMAHIDREKRVASLARQVGLSERLTHLPHELSGGQIQRAAIARALVNKPDIILADEPTGNLDSDNSRDVIDLFRQTCDTDGTAIVMATHDKDIAARADRIITMTDGAIND
jgi:putative ABC transport system ATP-binding protein